MAAELINRARRGTQKPSSCRVKVSIADLMNGPFLPDDSVSEAKFQSFRFVACLGRI
jgi:hypothetical protein